MHRFPLRFTFLLLSILYFFFLSIVVYFCARGVSLLSHDTFWNRKLQVNLYVSSSYPAGIIYSSKTTSPTTFNIVFDRETFLVLSDTV